MAEHFCIECKKLVETVHTGEIKEEFKCICSKCYKELFGSGPVEAIGSMCFTALNLHADDVKILNEILKGKEGDDE